MTMALNLPELDETTRKYMLKEFEAEEASGNPYRGASLSRKGLAAWSSLMKETIESGTDQTLMASLNDPTLWLPSDARGYRVNVRQASERLATSEFNTWYVRGLSARLLAEGVEQCQVFRAASPKWAPDSCSKHERKIVLVADVYAGHRRRYWPAADENAFSVPYQPGCHHSIRRLLPTD